MAVSPIQFKDILILEALPLISQRPPELSNQLVNRLMAISFEYFINQMFKEVSILLELIIRACQIFKIRFYMSYFKYFSSSVDN